MKLAILGGGGVRIPAFVRGVLSFRGAAFDEISLFEPFRGGERLQDAYRGRHLALDGCRLGASGLDQPPFGGRPLFRDELPHHNAGKHHDGQCRACGKQQQQRPEMKMSTWL